MCLGHSPVGCGSFLFALRLEPYPVMSLKLLLVNLCLETEFLVPTNPTWLSCPFPDHVSSSTAVFWPSTEHLPISHLVLFKHSL